MSPHLFKDFFVTAIHYDEYKIFILEKQILLCQTVIIDELQFLLDFV